MSEYVELFMDQGTDFSVTVQMNSEDNNLAQNLTGYNITSQMRKSLVSQNATASLVCSPEANTGQIIISLDSANTANIPAGTYFFDVKVKDTINSNTITRLIEGIIFVTPEITM